MTATWICLFVLVAAVLLPHWLPNLRTGHDKPIFFVLGLTIATMLVVLRAWLTSGAAGDRRRPPTPDSPHRTVAPLAGPRQPQG